jgi:type III HopA1-like effector protein
MDVQAKIKAFESKIAQSTVAPDLKQFLDMVWTHRADAATDYYKVYGLYIRERRRFNVDAGVMKAFFDALLTFGMLPEIQCSPSDPDDDLGAFLKQYYGATTAVSGFASLKRGNLARVFADAATHEGLRATLSETFYHFRRNNGQAAERIYLHVKPGSEAKVMEFVVKNLVSNTAGHPEISNGKVGSSVSIHRFDSIVIYLGTTEAVERALAAITEFQKGNMGLFEAGSPRTTRTITKHGGVNLIGVSTGAEPPTRGTSFGSVRCKAIFAALSQTVKANGSKDDFITKALEKLRAVGVDTSAPEIQH